MVKKIFLTLIIATISLSAFASSPYKTGTYLRAGVSYDAINKVMPTVNVSYSLPLRRK